MISKKENNIIYVRLEKSEEIVDSLYNIVKKYNIISGWINGIGAICNINIGSYNKDIKKYNEIDFKGDYELTSLIGNISIKNNNPFLHIHINFSDHKCNVYGGHLFSANILATGEFIIYLTNTVIDREFDENIGLHLWEFKSCE